MDSTVLDVTLESGAQVPMNRAVYEQLHSEAAKKVATYDNCLSCMTVNQHPDCEFPHVSGVTCNMVYHTRTEVPEMKAQFDKFHDLLLCNDLTEEIVNETDPFVVRHVVAHLHLTGMSILSLKSCYPHWKLLSARTMIQSVLLGTSRLEVSKTWT